MRTAFIALLTLGHLSIVQAVGLPMNGLQAEPDSVATAPAPPLPVRTTDVRQAWVTRIGMGSLHSSLKARCAAACPDGGIAISGSYLRQPLTARLSSTGEALWADVFKDSENPEVETANLCVDSSGSVYAILRARKRFDLLPWTIVVKYDATGQRAWVTAHPGLHKGSVVDAHGDVTLALHWNSPAMPDLGSPGYAVVRIDAGGKIRWRSTADGTWGSGADIASLDLDDAGNVFVTGLRARYQDVTTVSTVSFDAEGSMRWGNMHALPADRSVGACFASVDPAGAVVVIAAQVRTPYFELVQFDSQGIKKAIHTFSGTPRALLRESSGDLFLVTETDLQRLDMSGTVRWQQSRDSAMVFCAASGSLFAGRSVNGRMFVVAYDSIGARSWSVQPATVAEGSDELVALVSDRAGTVTATGTLTCKAGGADFIGHRIGRSGSVLTSVRYAAPPASSDRLRASCVDDYGNTYLAGTTSLGSGDPAMFLAKIDPAGNTVFCRQVTDPRAVDFSPFGMTVDGSGKIRVAGEIRSTRLVLFCFSETGTIDWVTTSTQSVDPYAAGIRTDRTGTTIVYGEAYFRQAIVVAFAPAGGEQWVRKHPADSRQGDIGAELDAEGNVIFGCSQGTPDNTLAGLVAKYAPDGLQIWAVTSSQSVLPLQGSGTQWFQGMVVDHQGRTVVALKNTKTSDGTQSLLTLCYSSEGTLLWWNDDLAGRKITPRFVREGKNGEVLMCGVAGSMSDFLLRYDSSGRRLSYTETDLRLWPTTGVVDEHGNMFVVGHQQSTTGGEDLDILSMSYGPSGSVAWIETFNSAQGASDSPVGIGTAPDGTVISTGGSIVDVQDGAPQETGTFATVVGYAPRAAPGSLVANPGFESDLRSWTCQTNGAATVSTSAPGEKSPLAARITIDRPDSGIVFYQQNLPLEPFAHYRLTFSARCNTGHDVAVSLIQHTEPHIAYGPREKICDLGREWTSFSLDFIAEGFIQHVRDGRIMFRFNGMAEQGDEYTFDNIVLERIAPPDAAADVRHPADARCGIGRPARLQVVAPQATAFQWLKNGEIIPGEEADALVTPVQSAADSGAEYSCLVAGPAGTFETRSAIMHVRNEEVSLVPNGRFSEDARGWSMRPGVPASLSVEGTPRVARVTVHSQDPGVWLMATGIELIGGASYRLTFRARSTTGHDLGVRLIKHTSPYTEYSPGVTDLDLTPAWQECSLSFIPPAGIGYVADARLMLWMSPYADAGDEYFFDDIMLEELLPRPSLATGVVSELPPPSFALGQNFPNPFNPETSIPFSLESRQHVRLAIYDVLGREIARPVDGLREAGSHAVRFMAMGMASGVYIYRLETPGQVLTRKMVLLK